jgi:hypothetical protein
MNETTAAKPVDTSLVKPTWIVLIVAWVIMLVPIPLITSAIGWIISIGAAVMAIISLTRGVGGVAIAQLVCAFLGTWLVQWVSVILMTTLFIGAALSAGG